MIKLELPYNYGDFVKAKLPEGDFLFGTVSAYNCVVKDGFLVCVSGYKQPICGDFIPSEVTLLTEEEINQLIKEHEDD